MAGKKRGDTGEASKIPATIMDQNDDASTRLQKKRESDRKCQRVSRERKKSHIAHLEGLLQQVKEADSSGRMDGLLRRISQLQNERDSFEAKLLAIEGILKPGPSKAPGFSKHQVEASGLLNDVVPGSLQEYDVSATSLFDILPVQAESEFPFTLEDHVVPELESDLLLSMTDPLQTAQTSTASDQNALSDPWPDFTPLASSETASKHPYFGLPSPTNSETSMSLLNQRTCGCGQAKSLQKLNFNHWYCGNVTLGAWMKWPSMFSMDPDADSPYHEDIPIRAVIEGWDAVESRGQMTPVWRLLRVMDDSLFRLCEDYTSRLGMMINVSRLIMAHMDPSLKLYRKLPPYLLVRHELAPFAYATNFLAWPNVRRMFVTHEHHYCSNRFWRCFIRSMRMQWPFEVRDSYRYNAIEGLYSISPTFLETLGQLQNLGVSRDFFDYYPEFRGQIMAVDEIPPSLSFSATMAVSGSETANVARRRGSSDSQDDHNDLGSELSAFVVN